MQVLTWWLAGIAGGWLTGFALRGRGFGILGNIVIGSAGGLVGGWVFRALEVTAAQTPFAHVFTALVGGVVLVASVRLLDQASRRASALAGGPSGELGLDIESQLARLGNIERSVLAGFLRRRPTATDASDLFDQRTSFGERVADGVAAFGGSWTFILLFLLVMSGWIFINARGSVTFDPYPFILLNLVLSCLAALQAPVIMMSQNRQASRDRLEAHQDYQVNLRTEVEMLSLHTKIDALREHDWRQVVEMQQRQIVLLESLLAENRSGPPPA